MRRNKKSTFIVTPENARINGFVRLTAYFAKLISGLAGFCKTYFCFQGANLELSIAKRIRTRSYSCKLELPIAIYPPNPPLIILSPILVLFVIYHPPILFLFFNINIPILSLFVTLWLSYVMIMYRKTNGRTRSGRQDGHRFMWRLIHVEKKNLLQDSGVEKESFAYVPDDQRGQAGGKNIYCQRIWC